MMRLDNVKIAKYIQILNVCFLISVTSVPKSTVFWAMGHSMFAQFQSENQVG